MATAWVSVKPSDCSRCTNLRVSKWWSRGRGALAWNARRLGRLDRMRELDVRYCVLAAGPLHGFDGLWDLGDVLE
jgi:hypothetical protein